MRFGRTVLGLLFLFAAASHLPPCARAGEPTDDRLGERTVPIFLLVRPDVQADLKLSSVQIAECHRAARTFQLRASQIAGRKDPAAVAARREVDEQLSQWLAQHLSQPQLSRFEQIDLQWEGAAAMLSRPFLDESLNLTPEQKKQVRDCIAEGKLERSRRAWTYNDHINLTRKAIAVLNPTQKDLWVRLLGPPCQFAIAAKPGLAPGQSAVAAAPNSTAPPR